MARFLREIRMREETERSEAVVDGDDDRSLRGKVLAVIPGNAAGSAGEAAAVDPHHDGPLVVRRTGAGPDVEIETILAACRLARGRSSGRGRRAGCGATRTATAAAGRAGRARRAKGVGIAHAVPLGRRLWR